MALPPEQNQAFLREVDEELRRDQALRIWQRWGKWIIAAIVVALVAVAGVIYLGHHRSGAASKQGERYDNALYEVATGKTDEALAGFESLGKDGSPGYAAMAKVSAGNILLIKKDYKGAAAKFGEVANDSSAPGPIRDLAAIRQTVAEFDTLKPETVIQRLEPYAKPDSAWFGTAGEMTAQAYLRKGDRAAAGKLYGEIARAEGVPDTLRQRAVQMASVLGIDTIDTNKEKKAQ